MVRFEKRQLRAAAILAFALAPAFGHAGSNLGATQVLRPLTTGDGGIGDRYGTALAASVDTLAVGAPYDTTFTPNAVVTDGVVTLYELSGSSVLPIGNLYAGDVTADDAAAEFGWSIAIEGDRLVVGAPLRDGGLGAGSGAVYVFERTGGAWAPVATLRSPAPASGVRFGYAVALAGGRIFVGTQKDNAVYVFEGAGATWTSAATIAGPGGSVAFGYSLAACDGRLVVGDPSAAAPAAPPSSGIAHRYDFNGVSWQPAGMLLASAPIASAAFGRRVACDGDVFAIGASGDLPGTPSTNGSAFVFDLSIASTALDALQPLASQAGDGFGGALAVDGGVIVVGAGGVDQAEGAVTFFQRTGNDWAAIDTVARNDGELADAFGTDVALIGDLAFVGAPLDLRGAHRSQGSVERYERSGDDFASLGLIDRGQGAGGEAFGAAVAVSDGTVLVGAPSESTVDGEDQAGTASFYQRNGAAFALGAKLESPEPASFDHFGDAVAVAGDLAVVGTPDAIVGGRLSQGAAYVFRRVAGTWQFEVKFLSADGFAGDLFGKAVATDGQRVLVGAPGNDAKGEDVGAAYVFRKGATWTGARLNADAEDGALLGYAVAIEDDVLAVGAPLDGKPPSLDAGGVLVFSRTNETWTFEEALAAAPRTPGQLLGISLAIDGDTIVAGANGENVGPVLDAGAVYVFAPLSGDYAQRQRIVRSAPVEGEQLGRAVAAEDGVLVAGAPFANDGAVEAGAALRYELAAGNLYAERAVLLADDPQAGALFGSVVAIDGPVVAIGEPERSVENPGEGAVYLFVDPDALFSSGFE